MAQQYFTNGNTMVTVDGGELGLSESPISITININHLDVAIQTFGGNHGPPGDVQQMLADATITMVLVYFDTQALEAAVTKSIGGNSTGVMPIAGQLMGVNSKFSTLTLSSPVGGLPWTFPAAYLTGSPVTYPIGNERTLAAMTWRAIPYKQNPSTAAGAILYQH